uniref:Cytochrome c oxidase subunit 3 n=1 Tax=Timarete posteria TaxID=2291963 RepID=A0A513X8R6_9ANNE|nr:cytochrome c oxidase subunit III [Timarete posteria]QDH12176.1 cytochrome c oxidase subunit III [Timarete posteria]
MSNLFYSQKRHESSMIPRSPFHLVDMSPWPLCGAMSAFNMTMGMVIWFHKHDTTLFFLSLLCMAATMTQWWRDVIREATFLGFHTTYVVQAHRLGMLLFITSEVMFFFAFFWGFFHSALAPTPQIACTWPPPGITPIDPFSVPLLNTAVLLASGFTVTWAHHGLLASSRKNTTQALFITCALGGYFTFLQIHEYHEAPFTIADGIYGSIFFVATGFHGLHVLIGTTFLLVCLYRTTAHHFSPDRHIGFEAAAWYWHFVDVVWIFLFLCIYWWGS